MNWIKSIFKKSNQQDTKNDYSLVNDEIEQLTSEAISKLNSSAWSEINLDLPNLSPWENIELSRTLMECMTLINKAINLNPKYGEPYGIRAHLHFLSFKFDRLNLVNDPFIKKDYTYVKKAIEDLNIALKIGARDKNVQSGWSRQLNYFKSLVS